TSEYWIRQIVFDVSFSRCCQFLQAKLSASSFAGCGFERIGKAGMYFIFGFGFDNSLPGACSLCVPFHRPVLFFNAFQNVRRVRSPTAVWKYRVSERELGQRDLAAPEKCGRIRTKRGTKARR